MRDGRYAAAPRPVARAARLRTRAVSYTHLDVYKRQDSLFLSQLPGASPLTNLLFDFVSKNREARKYLILPEEYARHARRLIEMLFIEYHFKDAYSNELMRHLAVSLFLVLIRGLYRRSATDNQAIMSDERIVSILNHIERSYGDCTLDVYKRQSTMRSVANLSA